MPALSRRHLVTSAAALPALAVPAVAIAAAAEPDPIFALIDQWKEAVAAEEAICDAQADAAKAFRDRHGSRRPSGFTRKLAEYFNRMGDELGDEPNPNCWLPTHKDITMLKSHRDFGRFVPFFHRTLNSQIDDYNANVAPFQEAIDRIGAMEAVFETVPTTLAGLRAKIDFAMSEKCVSECLTIGETDEPLRHFLDTLYESARLIAVQS
jgi:hypothetical protein